MNPPSGGESDELGDGGDALRSEDSEPSDSAASVDDTGDLDGEPPLTGVEAEIRRLASRLDRLTGVGRLLDGGLGVVRAVGDAAAPAWRRVTRPEPRLPVSLGVLVVIALMILLPDRVAAQPRWLFPTLASLVLFGLLLANPMRIDRVSRRVRAASLVLIAVLSVANAYSGVRLVTDLVDGNGIREPSKLLLTGAAIWMTNVVIFALMYWEFDRGGAAARGRGTDPYPDFLFPQMTDPELAPPDWEPQFLDYLYLSFTNATAFSPTDVMPLSRWAKFTMLVESSISLVTVALVVARAVNVLR